MRVIEAISDTNIGGAGILLVNRLSCTDLEKYKTTVLLPKGSILLSRLKEAGAECVEIDCKGDRSWSSADVPKYIKAIKEISPDIINCHGSLTARVAAKMVGVPVKICTRHCVFPTEKKQKLFASINNFLSDAFIAVAYSAKQNLLELGVREEKIYVVINGSKELRKTTDAQRKTLRKELGIKDTSKVLIMCARLEKCKGQGFFIRALSVLKNDGVDCVGLLVGEGNDRERLCKLCKELNVDDRVIFTGFRDDVAPFVNIADVNVNCSVGTETSSLALSEGMSLGVPCVVSDYGGNPYMVRHGENGLVYPAGDVDRLAKSIKFMLSKEDEYKKMSDASLTRFKSELNCASMTEKTNRLYDMLCKQ